MSQYSHFCEKCGWSSIDTRGGYLNCPSCGTSNRIVSTDLNTTSNLYRLDCQNCGWSSGPTTKGGISACPRCGKGYGYIQSSNLSSSSSSSTPSSVSSSTSSNSSNSDSGCALYLILLLFGIILIVLPGSLITMLLDVWVQFETGFWAWFWVIAFCLGVFLLCGFDYKKYLIFDAILVVICSILCNCIEKFSPFSWSWSHLFWG